MKSSLLFVVFIGFATLSYSQEQDNYQPCKSISAFTNYRYSQLNAVHRATENYDLKYHRLSWFVNPDTFYIEGSVTSYFVVQSATMKTISFDLDSVLTVDSVIFHNQKMPFSFSGKYALDIELYSVLSKGHFDSVTVFYQGIPSSNGFGSIVKGSHGNSSILWTLSEPYGSQDWWPCKQSLNDKVDSIDVFITTPFPNRAASNGLLVSEKRNGQLVTYHWKHRYPIPAYLIAISVTQYSVYTDYAHFGQDSFPILNYIYPEDSQAYRKNAKQTVPIMEFYMSRFGKYPFFDEKYGHAQFGRGGGMEHQTMSFMGSLSEFLVAHELAHQWFGDKITCHSWSDIWLNEGFATYCEGLWREYNYSDYSFYEWRRGHVDRITRGAGGSVYVYQQDTLSVGRVFDYRLSYEKAAMVLHMLRFKLGDSLFFKGLYNYITDPGLSFGYATTSDLIFHFEQVSGLDLTEFFDDWIYGEGYPIYDVHWLQTGHLLKVTIEQSQSVLQQGYFEMPVPIYFHSKWNDTTLIFDNTYNGQEYIVDLPFEVDSALIDRDFQLITLDNTISGNVIPPYGDDAVRLFPNPHYGSSPFTVMFEKDMSLKQLYLVNALGQVIDVPTQYAGTDVVKGDWFNLYFGFLTGGEYRLVIVHQDGVESFPFLHF